MKAGYPPSAQSATPMLLPSLRSTQKGFSLVEIVLAIGIIAFAFVALFGLLPVGLKVFRESVDEANETWILQSLNSMAQTTEWSKLDDLDHNRGGDIYYFDEEARMVDTEARPAGGLASDSRLYAAKLLVEEFSTPQGDGGSQVSESARRVIAVIAHYPSPDAMKVFEEITSAEDLDKNAGKPGVKWRSFLVAQMDSGI